MNIACSGVLALRPPTNAFCSPLKMDVSNNSDQREKKQKLLFSVVVQTSNKHEREHDAQRASNDVREEVFVICDSVWRENTYVYVRI